MSSSLAAQLEQKSGGRLARTSADNSTPARLGRAQPAEVIGAAGGQQSSFGRRTVAGKPPTERLSPDRPRPAEDSTLLLAKHRCWNTCLQSSAGGLTAARETTGGNLALPAELGAVGGKHSRRKTHAGGTHTSVELWSCQRTSAAAGGHRNTVAGGNL